MKTLKIDEKWSVEYDETCNDRPVRLLRYGEVTGGEPPSKWNNPSLAMFYALLNARALAASQPAPAADTVMADSKDMTEHRKLYDRWQEHALGIPAADTGQAVAGKSRNQIINRCSYDLAQLVQSHSPDQTSLNNLVWGRLQTMACEIEATHPAPLDAERVLNDLLDNAPTDTIRKYLRSQGAVPLQKRVERAALRQKENNNAE